MSGRSVKILQAGTLAVFVVLSLVAFVVNTVASGLNYLIPSINVAANYVIAICPFIAASMFTSWYTKRGSAAK